MVWNVQTFRNNMVEQSRKQSEATAHQTSTFTYSKPVEAAVILRHTNDQSVGQVMLRKDGDEHRVAH